MPLPINDTDLFLIEDLSGASKKIAASKLRDNLAGGTYDNFKLLVNKSNYTSAFVYAQNMQSSVTPSDWMLVERGGTSYKVSGQQIMDYFPSVPTAGCPGPIENINSDAGFSEPQTLTLFSDNHIGDLTVGDSIVMTDDGCNITSYTPTSSTITNVADSGSGGFKLTVADNQDVKYFKPGDVVQEGSVKGWQRNWLPSLGYESIGYGDGLWVATAETGGSRQISTATDPAGTWTKRTTNTGSSGLHDIAYGDGKWVICGAIDNSTTPSGTAAIMWAEDPKDSTNWNFTRDGSRYFGCIAFGNGYFVSAPGRYTAHNQFIWATSNDLNNWNTVNVLSGQWDSIIHAENKFVAVSKTGGLVYADDTDPSNWTVISQSDFNYNTVTKIAYGNGFYVVSGRNSNDIYWTEDLTGSWTKLTMPVTVGTGYSTIEFGNGVFVFVKQGEVMSAADPRGPWLSDTSEPTTTPSNVNVGWITIGYGNGQFVAVSSASDPNHGNDKYMMYTDVDLPTVVDRDVNEPSITVSGGEWSGSDGSGDPTGETIVTGPSKSGVGNFGGSSGNDITVTGSNHEWIDSDNREGKFFFLKNRNSRIGLAKLRERAVATAQAWAVDTGYMAEALVKHNGCYWLALSSNYNNSPDANDPLDWYNLGDVDPEQSTY